MSYATCGCTNVNAVKVIKMDLDTHQSMTVFALGDQGGANGTREEGERLHLILIFYFLTIKMI